MRSSSVLTYLGNMSKVYLNLVWLSASLEIQPLKIPRAIVFLLSAGKSCHLVPAGEGCSGRS
jgi:hypothetical protein